eukprot:TRINITY_DN2851_c1_g2_i1.p1 TRINITY_DN2851_c1_g2~~TRINITY_DN2851_c1_g2_i1.p1  ORF type:complete len:453 (+),score=42.25 TRINITY_DN2851_c1_g2_i1:106-1359(+)
MPILTDTQPEGEGLAATIGAVVQIGNVAPFVGLAARHYMGVTQSTLIFTVLFINISSAALLAMFSKDTIGDHSLPLLGLTLISSIGSCLSKIVWYPFAATYRQEAISAMSVGMGLSGLVCVLLGAVQNANAKIEDLRFQPKVFFSAMAGICAVGLAAYVYMIWSKKFALYWKGGYSLMENDLDEESVSSSESSNAKINLKTTPSGSEFSDEIISVLHSGRASPILMRIFRIGGPEILLSAANSYCNYLLMPGMFPYLQSDSGLFFWLISFYYISNTIGRYVPSFITSKISTLWVMICIMVVITGYLLSIGVMSRPWVSVDPPSWWGWIMTPVSLFAFLSGYVSTMVPTAIKHRELANYTDEHHATATDVEHLLQVIGIVTQIGSVSGTYTTFALSELSILKSIYVSPTNTVTLTLVG